MRFCGKGMVGEVFGKSGVVRVFLGKGVLVGFFGKEGGGRRKGQNFGGGVPMDPPGSTLSQNSLFPCAVVYI